MGRFILKFVKGLLAVCLVVIIVISATIAGLMYFGVTIDLGFLKSGVAASAQSALGREVSIDGPVVLEFSNWPAIDINGLTIANTAAASEPLFLSAGKARVQVGILPLLKGNIEIAEIRAEQVGLHLEHDAMGQPNWQFGSADEPSRPDDEQPEQETSERSDPFFNLSGIKKLSFTDIDLTYRDAALDKTVAFRLAELHGSAANGEPMKVDFQGHLQDYPYQLTLDSDPLDSLLSRTAQTWQFSLQGKVVEKQVAVSGDYDKGTIPPQANLGFRIDEIDVGAVLARLGLVEDLEASTGSMEVQITLKGDNLNEIVQQSSMSFSVRDGKWRIQSPTSDGFIEVEELAGDIVVEEGNAVTMTLTGMVGTLPVNFLITGAPLVEYVIDQKSIPLSIEAQFANSTLGFGGELSLPISNRQLDVFLDFKTDTLENFNDLVGVELPSLGPIDFSTKFQVVGNRYEMPTLDLRVGESLLTGLAHFDPSQAKPEISIELVSEKIQINDFQGLAEALPDRKDDESATPEESEKAEEAGDEPAEAQKGEQRKNILSPEVLSAFNATLFVKAEEVLSGTDRLGSGTLKMSVQDSLLSVDPLRVDIPGGGVQASFDYLPGYDGVRFNLATEIEEFDIGVLVRRSKPESDMGGLLFLDAALQSEAPNPASIMEYAEGHFDFGLVPENFSAGIIDLWAVNLISAIMTEVSEEEKSEINCFIVRLGVDEGIMAEKAIYMDTSNMRIGGKADIDFKNRTLKILMVPKAKKPEFFSLAVPIRIEGAFDDFGLGIGLSRLTGAVVSFITSPIHVPVRRVFAAEVPEDGVEACRAAWALTEEDESQ